MYKVIAGILNFWMHSFFFFIYYVVIYINIHQFRITWGVQAFRILLIIHRSTHKAYLLSITVCFLPDLKFFSIVSKSHMNLRVNFTTTLFHKQTLIKGSQVGNGVRNLSLILASSLTDSYILNTLFIAYAFMCLRFQQSC